MNGLNDRNMSFIKSILCKLDDRGFLFPEYKLIRLDEGLHLIGKSENSCVYKMFCPNRDEKAYVLKVSGFGNNALSSKTFKATNRLQKEIAEACPNVCRIISSKELLVTLDEMGEIISATESSDEQWNENGLHLQFVLMEYLERIITVDKFNKASLLKSDLDVLHFALDIANAIYAAHTHEEHILHRDIKLENTFWDPYENCYKLSDFSLAKRLNMQTDETAVNTDGYLAPEIQISFSENYEEASDIYSLGIILYLLTNNLCFPFSRNYKLVYDKQYDAELTFPKPVNASEKLANIINKMCAYYVEDRYKNISQVIDALSKLSSGQVPQEDNGEQYNNSTESYSGDSTNVDDYNESLSDYSDYSNHSTCEADSYDDSYTSRYIDRSREERLRDAKIDNEIYSTTSFGYMLGLTLTFTLWFYGFGNTIVFNASQDLTFIQNLLFWGLPIAVFLEAILLRIKEFHITFGIVTIGFAIYSMMTVGVSIPHIVLLLSVLSGMSVLVASVSIATIIWMLLIYSNSFTWLQIIGKYNLGWIFLIAILVLICKLIELRYIYDKESNVGEAIGLLFCDNIAYAIIICGVVLLIINKLFHVDFPDVVSKLCLIRTGIATLIALKALLWRD